MAWTGVITNAGNALLSQWASEKTLHIDSAAAGTNRVSVATLMAQTTLASQKQTASIVSGEQLAAGYKVKLQITAPDAGYNLSQYGIWGRLDDGGSTLLALFQNDRDIPIPSKDDSPDFVYTFYALLAFDNTGKLELHIDSSAVVTLETVTKMVSEAVATKQDKIMVEGLLKGDGQGNITAATLGEDYGLPMVSGHGAPTEETEAVVGQHYFDEDSGKEYVCTEKSEEGKTTWKQAGATDADDLTYNGGRLSDALDAMGKAIDGAKPLTGTSDPDEHTKGAVGQTYLNTETGQTFVCTEADDESGTYTWTESGGGGVKPQITVTVATGSEVTCTCGETVLRGTSVGGTCVFNLPRYGTWELQATLSGQTSDKATVVVDQVKQYTVTLSYFAATLTVTAESGASVEAVNGTHRYTGTCGSSGTCALTVNYPGQYTVKATKESCTSSTATANVTDSGSSYTAKVAFITLIVTIDAGSKLTVSKDSHSFTNNSTTGTTTKFYLPETGTWKAVATKDDQSAEGSVNCSAYQGYTLELSYVKIVGVCWTYSGTSTACSRLTKTGDPNHLVNVDILTEPKPAVGTGTGSSPFDQLMPWAGMEEYNVSGSSFTKKGSGGFARSNDTVVLIPEYYFRIIDDASGKKRYFYVADKAKTGFTKHPGSGKYVGRYNTSGSVSAQKTVTGQAPLASQTRGAFRTGAKQKGTKWRLYDYASWCAVWLLFLVEFADWDSQKKVGRGYVDGNSSPHTTGGTDSMNYHTGRADGADGKTQVQYRHIEDPWGSIWEWIDGINFKERVVHICLTPANYADDTDSNYTAAGITLCADGWITEIGASTTFPWAFLPTKNGGSETTCIPDYVYSNTGWVVLVVGGYYNFAGYAGLWCFYAYGSSSYSSSYIGGRLLVDP